MTVDHGYVAVEVNMSYSGLPNLFMSRVDSPAKVKRINSHLVLDLDHTLISSFEFGEAGIPRRGVNTVSPILTDQYIDDSGLPEMYHATISNVNVLIKLRPWVRTFVRKASESGLTLHVYTKGRRAYMMEILRLIDPDMTLFDGRLVSRDDEPSHMRETQKDVKLVIPSLDETGAAASATTHSITVLDDSPHVWSYAAAYSCQTVIGAKRYTFSDKFVSFLRTMDKAAIIKKYPKDVDTYLMEILDSIIPSPRVSEMTTMSSSSSSPKLAPYMRSLTTSTTVTASLGDDECDDGDTSFDSSSIIA